MNVNNHLLLFIMSQVILASTIYSIITTTREVYIDSEQTILNKQPIPCQSLLAYAQTVEGGSCQPLTSMLRNGRIKQFHPARDFAGQFNNMNLCYIENDERYIKDVVMLNITCSKSSDVFNNPIFRSVAQSQLPSFSDRLPRNKCILEIDETQLTPANITKLKDDIRNAEASTASCSNAVRPIIIVGASNTPSNTPSSNLPSPPPNPPSTSPPPSSVPSASPSHTPSSPTPIQVEVRQEGLVLHYEAAMAFERGLWIDKSRTNNHAHIVRVQDRSATIITSGLTNIVTQTESRLGFKMYNFPSGTGIRSTIPISIRWRNNGYSVTAVFNCRGTTSNSRMGYTYAKNGLWSVWTDVGQPIPSLYSTPYGVTINSDDNIAYTRNFFRPAELISGTNKLRIHSDKNIVSVSPIRCLREVDAMSPLHVLTIQWNNTAEEEDRVEHETWRRFKVTVVFDGVALEYDSDTWMYTLNSNFGEFASKFGLFGDFQSNTGISGSCAEVLMYNMPHTADYLLQLNRDLCKKYGIYHIVNPGPEWALGFNSTSKTFSRLGMNDSNISPIVITRHQAALSGFIVLGVRKANNDNLEFLYSSQGLLSSSETYSNNNTFSWRFERTGTHIAIKNGSGQYVGYDEGLNRAVMVDRNHASFNTWKIDGVPNEYVL